MSRVSISSKFTAQVNPAPPPEKLYPMSFRVTAKEKARIQDFAGDKSISHYLRQSALKGKVYKRKAETSVKVEMAARILGALGQSDISSNLRRIADAADMGALPVTDELEEELRNACALVLAIRHDLIIALGIKPQD